MRINTNNRRKKDPVNLERFKEYAKTMNKVELAEKYGCSSHTITRWFETYEIQGGVKRCSRCGENVDISLFSHPNSTVCTQEHQSNPNASALPEGEYERMLGREMQSLSRFWMATEQGQPNGPVRAVEV